jgi:hypothetical protein
VFAAELERLADDVCQVGLERIQADVHPGELEARRVEGRLRALHVQVPIARKLDAAVAHLGHGRHGGREVALHLVLDGPELQGDGGLLVRGAHLMRISRPVAADW